MNLWQAIHQAEITFKSHGVDSPRIEAELLLRHVAGLQRARLYAELQEPLENPAKFWELVERRLSHEPAAYITNRRAFYGLDFYVDSRVLIPRQETELLVDEVLKFARENFLPTNTCLVADIGTGSGAIAISLASNMPQAEIYATDISANALEVADINCQHHGVTDHVHILQGDMLQPLPMSMDIIVANLPYISNSDMEQLSPEIERFEPSVALSGGPDGLDKVRILLGQVKCKLRHGGALLFEIGQGQSGTAIELCKDYFPGAQIETLVDLAGIERVITVCPDRVSNSDYA